MINQLRDEARFQVEILAKSYSDAINSSNQEDIRFVMDILLPSIKFPVIITSNNEKDLPDAFLSEAPAAADFRVLVLDFGFASAINILYYHSLLSILNTI